MLALSRMNASGVGTNRTSSSASQMGSACTAARFARGLEGRRPPRLGPLCLPTFARQPRGTPTPCCLEATRGSRRGGGELDGPFRNFFVFGKRPKTRLHPIPAKTQQKSPHTAVKRSSNNARRHSAVQCRSLTRCKTSVSATGHVPGGSAHLPVQSDRQYQVPPLGTKALLP